MVCRWVPKWLGTRWLRAEWRLIVVGDAVVDFALGSGSCWKAAAVEPFGFEAAPKRFGACVAEAAAAPAPALLGPVVGE